MVKTGGNLITLVLYSRKDSLWKLADFGFTCEGTSSTLLPSSECRGTPCYRAPELLSHNPVYNNKIDIWSMGCILYECATRRRTFSSDYAIEEYKRHNQVLEFTLDENFSDQCKRTIIPTIHNMLQVDPISRPSAESLLGEFIYYFKMTEFPHPHSVQIHHAFIETAVLPQRAQSLDNSTQYPFEVVKGIH